MRVKRLLLAFLTLCLAFPAIALPIAGECHGMPAGQAAEAAAHHEHGTAPTGQDQGSTGQHDCIGCIAPVMPITYVPAGRPDHADRIRPGIAQALPEARAGPDTPPPKV